MTDSSVRRWGGMLSREGPSNAVAMLSLGAAMAVFIIARWLRLGTFWGDASLWLFEAYRASVGEMPYRDFMWPYPPLSLWLFAAWFRTLGATFQSAQILISLLSVSIIVLTWDVARRVLSGWTAFAVALTLIAISGTSASDLALFSLRIYTPALLTGLVGNLLMLRGAVDLVSVEGRGRAGIWWFTLGSFIALLSKHESIAAALATMLAVVIALRSSERLDHSLRWWITRSALLVSLATGPAALVYLAIVRVVGWHDFRSSILGYGIAGVACPWWPTGLGVLGGLTALGQGAIVLAAAAALELATNRRRPTTFHALVGAGAVAGVILLAVYLPMAEENYPPNALGAIGPALSYLLSIRGFFFPAMWWLLVGCAVMGIRMLVNIARGQVVPPREARTFLVVAVGASLCTRSIFGNTLSNLSTTPVSAVPILMIGVFGLLDRVLLDPRRAVPRTGTWRTDARTFGLVVGLVLAYAIVKVAASAVLASRRDYQRIATTAGPVILDDGGLSAGVYRYVVTHTAPQDYVLDIPYGGGTNFASHRPSPIYSTLLVGPAPDDELLARDRDGVAARKPSLVLVPDLPLFGTEYGMNPRVGCTYPAVRWTYVGSGRVPRRVPLVEYIEGNYLERTRIQHMRILALRD